MPRQGRRDGKAGQMRECFGAQDWGSGGCGDGTRAGRGRGKMGSGGQGCAMGSWQHGSWDVGLPTCSVTPSPFPGGPEATRKESGLSRGKLGFGN